MNLKSIITPPTLNGQMIQSVVFIGLGTLMFFKPASGLSWFPPHVQKLLGAAIAIGFTAKLAMDLKEKQKRISEIKEYNKTAAHPISESDFE